jgi:ATP-dependent exoDNAse (exonuclease V) beta subunit
MSSQHLRTRIRAHHPEDDAERDFLALADVIYDAYLDEVIGGGFEDFKGIMWRAVSKVENGDTEFIRDRGRERGDLMAVRHILIDEFQDFTKPFHALIHAIQMVNTEARVFAVGDDWQAINGFAGSDLQFFNGFNRFFENATKYLLTTNYRSAETIVAASNALMKPVDPAGPFGVASTDRRGQVRLWKLSRFTPSPSEIDLHGNERLIPAVLRLVNDNLEAGRDVHMLSRTNTMNNQDLKAFLRTVRSHLQPGYADRVQASTTHLFKGLEEQAIIILDADKRRYPLIHRHWKYQRLFGDTEGKIGEEERRLFYVALTRAVSSLDIINAKAEEDESPFLICLEHRVRHGSWDRISPKHPPEQVFAMWNLKWFEAKPDLRRLFRDQPELRDEFLEKKEVADLSKMSREIVRQAINVSHLLEQILEEAQRLEATGEYSTPKTPLSGGTSSKPKPQKPKPPSSGGASSKPVPKSRRKKSSPSNNDPYRSASSGHRPQARPTPMAEGKYSICPGCDGRLTSDGRCNKCD